MENHGSKLRSIIKSRGYDLVGLAKLLNITTAAIQKDLSNNTITRRSLVKYVPTIITSVDEFLEQETKTDSLVDSGKPIGLLTIIDYKDSIIESQNETIREQRRHIDTLSNMLSFFPSAVKQKITA